MTRISNRKRDLKRRLSATQNHQKLKATRPICECHTKSVTSGKVKNGGDKKTYEDAQVNPNLNLSTRDNETADIRPENNNLVINDDAMEISDNGEHEIMIEDMNFYSDSTDLDSDVPDYESENEAEIESKSMVDLYRDKTLENKYIEYFKCLDVGLEYVCTSCERYVYAGNATLYKKNDLTEEAKKYVMREVPSVRDKVWLCMTCETHLLNAEIPPMSVYNGLQLDPVPDCMKDLNTIEKNLISQRIGFKKVVKCPKGGQLKIKGQVLNVPTSTDEVCTVFPRLPKATELYHVQLKRDLAYSSVYLEDYANIEQILASLRFLKKYNRRYNGITISNENLLKAKSWVVPLLGQYATDDINHILDSVNQNKLEQICVDLRLPMSKNLDWVLPVLDSHSVTITDTVMSNDSGFEAILLAVDDTISKPEQLRQKVYKFLRESGDTYKNFKFTLPTGDDMYFDLNKNKYCRYFRPDKLTRVNNNFDYMWHKYLMKLRDDLPVDSIVLQVCSILYGVDIRLIQESNSHIFMASDEPRDSTLDIIDLSQSYFVPLVPITTEMKQQVSELLLKVGSKQKQLDEEQRLRLSKLINGKGNTRDIPESDVCLHDAEISGEGDPLLFAPGAGFSPKSIFADTYFEVLSNPDKFPYGRWGYYDTFRPIEISMKQYIKQRLENIDDRFRMDTDYLFSAKFAIEAEQLISNMQIAIRRIQGKVFDGEVVDANFISDPEKREKLIKNNLAYKIFNNIRGSPSFWKSQMLSTMSLVRQIGKPVFFLTLSAAEGRWTDTLRLMTKAEGKNFTDKELISMPYLDRCKLVARHPVLLAKHFDYKVKNFFNHVLKSEEQPIGPVDDYVYRVEFQGRGSCHIHALIFSDKAPTFEKNSLSEIKNFVDKYQTCSIPNDTEFANLVRSRMRHVHNHRCKFRGGHCRFDFPKLPMKETVIIKHEANHIPTDTEKYEQIIEQFKKMSKKKSFQNLSIDDFVAKLGLTYEQYQQLVVDNHSGKGVLLARNCNEIWINNYNPDLLKIWKANIDFQYILDPYACIKYITSYMLKPEYGMSKLLHSVTKVMNADSTRDVARMLSTAWFFKREISAQEAAYRALSLPLKMSTRTTVYIDSKIAKHRCGIVVDQNTLKSLPKNCKNYTYKNIFDYYPLRSADLDHLSLAELVSAYEFDGYTKTGGVRFKKRDRNAIIRYFKPRMHKNPDLYIQSLLLLYVPWRNENIYDIPIEELRDMFSKHKHTILENQMKFQKVDEDHLADLLDKFEAEVSKIETDEKETDVISDYMSSTMPELEKKKNPKRTKIRGNIPMSRVKCQKEYLMEKNECDKSYVGLNYEQKMIIDYCRNWCEEFVHAKKNCKKIAPFYVNLNGVAGTGKSHCIKHILHDFTKYIPQAGGYEVGLDFVLVTAPTGTAAFNIDGQTIHSALGINPFAANYENLGSVKLHEYRNKYANLELLVIDEISMVSAKLLMIIDKRLQEIKDRPGVPFGGICVLVTGDFMQLNPVNNSPCFDATDNILKPRSQNLWFRHFKTFNLKKVMRQDDEEFIELLNRVRVGALTQDDVTTLRSRDLKLNEALSYNKHHLHVFLTNEQVRMHNRKMMNEMQNNGYYTIPLMSKYNTRTNYNGSKLERINICVDCPVIITENIDVSEGLVNGSRGVIRQIITDDTGMEVQVVLIEFENKKVGQKYKNDSRWKDLYPGLVPIHRKAFLDTHHYGTSNVIDAGDHFPFYYGWASTVHKVQGLTLNNIVVSFQVPKTTSGKCKFQDGQAYVALSRVPTLENLYLLNFQESEIRFNRFNSTQLNLMKDLLCSRLYPKQSQKSKYQFGILNVQKLRNNMMNLIHVLSCTTNFAPHVMVLTECTMKSDSYNDKFFQHIGYDIYGDKTCEQSQVMLLLKKELGQCHQIFRYGTYPSEITSFGLTLGRLEVNIISVYRSPSDDLVLFLKELRQCITQSNIAMPVIVAGDLNLKPTSTEMLQLDDYMCSHDFVKVETGFTTSYGTTIDYVYCRGLNLTEATSMSVHFTDHRCITANF